MIKQTIAALLLSTGIASAQVIPGDLDIDVVFNEYDTRSVTEVEQSANGQVCRVIYRPSLDILDNVQGSCTTATWGQLADESRRTFTGVDLASTLADPQPPVVSEVIVDTSIPSLTISVIDDPADSGRYGAGVDTYRTVTTAITEVTAVAVNLCEVSFDADDVNFHDALPVNGACTSTTWGEAYRQWSGSGIVNFELVRLNGVDLGSFLSDTPTSYVPGHGASPGSSPLTAAPTHDEDGNRISGRYNTVDDSWVNPSYNYPGALHDLYHNDPADSNHPVVAETETPRTTLELPSDYDLRSIPQATVCEYYAHESDDARLTRLEAEINDPSVSDERKDRIVEVLGSEINRGSCNDNGRQELIILWGSQ